MSVPTHEGAPPEEARDDAASPSPSPGTDAAAEDVGATAQERGETVSGATRWILRGLVLLLVAGGVIAVALLRNGGSPSLHSPTSPAPAKATASQRPPTSPRAAAARRRAVMDQEAGAVTAEDARLSRITLAPSSATGQIAGSLMLGARLAPYTWADLEAAGAVRSVGPDTFLLTEPIVVRRGAVLDLAGPGVTLRMLSTPARFTSVVGWGGSIHLTGARRRPLRIVSWDPATGGPDLVQADGRAYLRLNGGRLTATHLRTDQLGFWSGRTGGLALTGNGRPTTARLDDVTSVHGYVGLYASDITGLAATGLAISHARWYGVYLSDGSRHVRFHDLTIAEAASGGVEIDDGSADVRVDRARVTDTGGHGLAMDGRPLAVGPNAGGYGIDNFGGLRVTRSHFSHNSAGGVAVTSVDDVTIRGTTVRERKDALLVGGASAATRILDTTAVSREGTAVSVAAGARQVSLSTSTLEAPSEALTSSSPSLRVDHDRIRVGTGHGVVLSGGAAVLRHDVIVGRGSSAVAVHDGARATRSDVGGAWAYRPQALLWGEAHTALLPLVPVAVVPLIGLLFILHRARRQRRLRKMLHAAITARSRELLDDYRADQTRVAVEPPAAVAQAAQTAQPPQVAQAAPPEPSVPAPEKDVFTPLRQFAVAAIRDFGYTPAQVARVLHVPTSRVRAWLADDEAAASATGGS